MNTTNCGEFGTAVSRFKSKHPLSTVIDSLMFDDSPRALV